VAFYIGANNVEDENKIMEIFRDIGIYLNLIGYLFTTQERLNNGILPYIVNAGLFLTESPVKN